MILLKWLIMKEKLNKNKKKVMVITNLALCALIFLINILFFVGNDNLNTWFSHGTIGIICMMAWGTHYTFYCLYRKIYWWIINVAIIPLYVSAVVKKLELHGLPFAELMFEYLLWAMVAFLAVLFISGGILALKEPVKNTMCRLREKAKKK